MFAKNYQEARARFISAAREASCQLTFHPHPLLDPNNQEMGMDVAYHGRSNAKKCLMISSATHGVEGYYGSAVQTGLLESELCQSLDNETAIMLIHTINPYGFAYDRRVNEDNIDVNRNFMNFDQVLPKNAAYEHMIDWIIPEVFKGPIRDTADTEINKLIEHNFQAFTDALMQGQYEFPHGLFYGGDKPTWSNETVCHILKPYAHQFSKVIYIDLHTGYGDYEQVEIYTGSPSTSDNHKNIVKTCDGVANAISSPFEVKGLVLNAARHIFAKQDLLSFVIECGTKHLPDSTILALRDENIMMIHGDQHSSEGQASKKALKDAYCVRDTHWQQTIYDKTQCIISACLNHLNRV